MENPACFAHMGNAETRVISSRAAILKNVVINNAGGLGAVMTIYNNTAGSGDVVAVIDLLELNERTIKYDISCPKGLTVKTAVATGGDYTITYEAPEV